VKPFSTMVLLRSPPDRLFAIMRDRLPEIAAALPDIAGIEEVERAPGSKGLRLVNRWEAGQAVPKFLQGKLGTERIVWMDHAVWSNEDTRCDWSITPLIGDGAIECRGTTRFEPAMAGRGSRAMFGGTLAIAPDFIASLVGPLQGPVTALVEAIATTIIPANFRAVAEAAARLD